MTTTQTPCRRCGEHVPTLPGCATPRSTDHPYDCTATGTQYPGLVTSRPRPSARCSQCEGSGASIPATDTSGIPGVVCAPCYRSGHLSFA